MVILTKSYSVTQLLITTTSSTQVTGVISVRERGVKLFDGLREDAQLKVLIHLRSICLATALRVERVIACIHWTLDHNLLRVQCEHLCDMTLMQTMLNQHLPVEEYQRACVLTGDARYGLESAMDRKHVCPFE
jgi:hypothetical protein